MFTSPDDFSFVNTHSLKTHILETFISKAQEELKNPNSSMVDDVFQRPENPM